MRPAPVPILASSAVTPAGDGPGAAAAWRALRGLPREEPAAGERLAGWLRGFAFPEKQKKFFDRASILLYRALEPLLPRLSALPADEVGLFLAVGPNRGDLDFFVEWAERDRAEAPGPHAGHRASDVVRLLPNLPVSNLSIPLSIRGGNAIFAGFSPAGAHALGAALARLREGTLRAALVAAVSSPHNYFNMDSFRRFLPDVPSARPPAEGAAALLLGAPGEPAPGARRIGRIAELSPAPGAAAERLLARHPRWNGIPVIEGAGEAGDLRAAELPVALAGAGEAPAVLCATDPFGAVSAVELV